jgi:hypothetical protein
MVVFLIQTVTGVFTFKPLNGVDFETEKPKLTLKSYADGSFQENVEQYLREHFGFREPLIRCYNQYLWSCLHKTNNITVARGKEGWLFEEWHVRDFYESMMYKYTDDSVEMAKTFETEVQRLKKVQELLEEYNIHLFVVIPPCKSMVYPEYLPRNFSYLRPAGLHAYDYYKRRFEEIGVNCIDFVPVCRALKDSVDYLLSPKTGTHWTNIASVYAFDSILRYMEVLGNQNLVNLDIGEKYQAETRQPDNDLEMILNLAFPIKSLPNWYVDVKAKEDSTAIKPIFLTVGDSYYFNIIGNNPMNDIFQAYPYWYYNSTIYYDEGNSSTLEIDIEKELMRPDYIMLIYNPCTMYEFGSYFLPRALLHLCYDSTTIDSMALDLVETITLYDKPLYNKTLQRAEESGQSIDKMLYDNALYLLRTEPEKYFKELKGSRMPVSRNRDLKAYRKAK